MESKADLIRWTSPGVTLRQISTQRLRGGELLVDLFPATRHLGVPAEQLGLHTVNEARGAMLVVFNGEGDWTVRHNRGEVPTAGAYGMTPVTGVDDTASPALTLGSMPDATREVVKVR